MPAPRTFCSKGVCHLGAHVARRRGAVASFASHASSGTRAQPSTASLEGALRRGRQTPGKAPRKQMKQPRPWQPRPPDKSALAIFNDVVKKDEEASRGAMAQKPLLSDWEIAANLEKLKGARLPPQDRYQAFMRDIWPHLKALDRSRPLPQRLYTLSTSFLVSLCNELIRKNLLQPGDYSMLSKVHDRIARFDLRLRTGFILAICLNLSKETDGHKKDELFDELINMWKFISLRNRPGLQQHGLQFALPSLQDVTRSLDAIERRLARGSNEEYPRSLDPVTAAFCALLNQFKPGYARYAVPGLLATVAVISQESSTASRERRADAAPLLELMRVVLDRFPIGAEYIHNVFNSDDIRFFSRGLPELRAFVEDRWPGAMEMLNDEDATWRLGLMAKPRHKTAKTNSLAHYHKMLRSAHQTNNIGVIISLWQEIKTKLAESKGLEAEMRSDPEFLNFWHFVWCASRRPDMLQETQKVMHKVGLDPTIKTYTAMMHGWKLSRDLDKIAAMWDTLIKSPIKLDTHAWTERISGLIELGHPQRGINTLAEMLATWKEAVRQGRPDDAVQPTIEVVNAAFKPLVRIDRKAAYDVLEWAGREGIKPNILTYNILLRECFKNRQADDDVSGLMRAMRDQNVEPDAATFTIILEEALGNLQHAPAEEQVAAVHQINEDIMAAGVLPNLETYGKMLHAVASLSNGSDAAIDAVLDCMRATGHTQISPHMVLILINRAVNRGQRNPDVVRALLNQHGFTSIHAGDQRLWEHVVSTYAILGDTNGALGLYDDLHLEGRPVTRLSALRELLLALIEQSRMNDGKRVVGEVLEQLTDHTVSERSWKHHFWHQAYKYELLDWNKAPADLRREVDERRFNAEGGQH